MPTTCQSHASHMPVTCQSHASCIRNTVVRGIHHTPAASPRHTCQVELLRWSTHGRSGPQVAMSYTCSGFRSCLNLLKNLTPWLSPLRELTRATHGFWRALLSQGYAWRRGEASTVQSWMSTLAHLAFPSECSYSVVDVQAFHFHFHFHFKANVRCD